MRALFPFLLLFFSLANHAQTKVDTFLTGQGLEQATLMDGTGLEIAYARSIHAPEGAGLVVYCTGSLPVPLFIEEGGEFWATLPSFVRNLAKTHHFVVMSKPGLALAEPRGALNDNYQAMADDGRFRQVYLDRNYLDYYVTTTQMLLDTLLAEQSYPQVVLMGHSQGARVAAKVAATHSAVSHLVYLSGNPLGRYDQLIREKREANLLGQLSDEEAQAQIEDLYARWRQIHTDPENLETGRGDSNKTWASFSESTVDELLSLDIPIFVGYGTRDIVSRYCDLLPLHFIEAGKDNLTLKAYPGYDHSFYRKLPDGRADFEDSVFGEVVEEVRDWLREDADAGGGKE